MDSEANKDLVRRYLEMWNTGNVELVDEVLASNWVDHAHPEVTGSDSVKQSLSQVRAAFPDFRIMIKSIVSEGDIVALRATIQRTHQGKAIISGVMWFVRVADGKMAEMWTGSEASS